MLGRNLGENLYKTKLNLGLDTISGNPFDEKTLSVEIAPLEDAGWIWVDFLSDTNRDLIYFHRRDGTTLYYYVKNRSKKGISHKAGTTVQINDVAQWINSLSRNTEDFGYIDAPIGDGLKVKVYGGRIRKNEKTVDVSDTFLTLTDDATNYIYLDYSDNTIKATTISPSFPVLGEVITSGGNISSKSDITDKRYVNIGNNLGDEFIINSDNEIKISLTKSEFDTALSDGTFVYSGDNVSDLTNDVGYISDITGEKIGDLSNVTFADLKDGQILSYDSGNGYWKNISTGDSSVDISDDGSLVVNGVSKINFRDNLSVVDNEDGSVSVDGTGSTGVAGPDSSTDNAIARFDGTGGDTIQNSGITIDDSDNINGAGVDLTNNTLSGTKSEFNTALSDDNFAFLGTANTFTANQTFSGTAGYSSTDDMGSDDTDFASKKYVDDNVGGGGTDVAVDLGNTGSDEISALTRINTANDTNSIITNNTGDEILIDMNNNRPTADTVAALTGNDIGGLDNVNTENLSAGEILIYDATAGEYVNASITGGTEISVSQGDGSITIDSDFTPSSTDTLTNKTFDANGTGNSLDNVEVENFADSAIVTESEGISNNDNDTTLPTSAAVKDYVDNNSGGSGGEDAYNDNGNSGSAITIDFSTSNNQSVVIDQDTTITIAGVPDGQKCWLSIYDGGNYTVTFAESVTGTATIYWGGNTGPTLTTDGRDKLAIDYNGADNELWIDYGLNFGTGA